MIEIYKSKENLILKYYSEFSQPNWVDEKLQSDSTCSILKVFHLEKSHFLKKNETDDVPVYYFRIGSLQGQYFLIDRSVFRLENEVYFHKDIEINENLFVAKPRTSILSYLDKVLSSPIYIGGEDKKEELPFSAYDNLIKSFPSDYEIKLYRHARITSILREYFEHIPDKELSYKKYINKKTPSYDSGLIKTFKDSEIEKYEKLLERLQRMLDEEETYSEKQWQNEILQFILLLFPKYVAVFDEMKFKDSYSGKTRRMDYGLVDFGGNLDIVEIKIPFRNKIVTDGKYRDNHIPRRDLSGTIMQIEKYIYYLNKGGRATERRLTEKYRARLPEGMKIKITNPSGMIIMGRDKFLSQSQLKDFEIIKRKYKHVIDIFTYDDLLRRLDVTICQLKLM